MNLQVDLERLSLAHKAVRAELLAERTPRGHWVGHVASSPFATAAAVSALVVAHQTDTEDVLRQSHGGPLVENLVQGDLCEFLVESVHWLARNQNPDGGWGDCDAAQSNVAATMLVQAAFRLTGIPAKYANLMLRADQYITAQGGLSALRRKCEHNRTLVAAILSNCALAGMVPWRQVPTLPFELVCLPRRWRQRAQIPIVRHATPALVAVGHAKYHHDPPRNPITRLLRRSMRSKSLAILERLQADDDSFLASTTMTSFVVMNLASVGLQDHPIVRRGIEFLLSSVRADSSWPVTTNLATTVTTLALESLAESKVSPKVVQHAGQAVDWETATASETVTDVLARDHAHPFPHTAAAESTENQLPIDERPLTWLLESQHTRSNRVTEVPAGGWAASDQPGALPNTSDTAGALLMLARWPRRDVRLDRTGIDRAARLGVEWLLEMQTEDGGWPTYYRDTTGLPALSSDEPGTDATAQALRALAAWRQQPSSAPALRDRIDAAIERGWRYLESAQRDDGCFEPLWFGNEYQADDFNPVYGTVQILMACADLNRLNTDLATRAANWLLTAQHSTGGWGPPRAPLDYSGDGKDGFRAWRANDSMAAFCTVEETALAISAILPLVATGQNFARAAATGLMWLANAVEQDAHRRPATIGFYLSKLWYHERLYPLVFADGALSRAMLLLATEQPAAAPVGSSGR